MRVLSVIFRCLFVAAIPLLLVTAALRIPASCPYLYEYLFSKYEVGYTTGLDTAALRDTARGLTDYFNSNQKDIDLVVRKDGQPFRVFNEREVVHLRDVKALFRLDLTVFQITAAFVLGYTLFHVIRGRREGRVAVARSVIWGAGLTLVLMAVLGVGMLFNFDSLLLDFHLISFSNDFWQLDPSHDYLIMLVTRGFMYDASFIVAAATAAGSLVLGAAGYAYLRHLRRERPVPGN